LARLPGRAQQFRLAHDQQGRVAQPFLGNDRDGLLAAFNQLLGPGAVATAKHASAKTMTPFSSAARSATTRLIGRRALDVARVAGIQDDHRLAAFGEVEKCLLLVGVIGPV
jgi:hypothetical protein